MVITKYGHLKGEIPGVTCYEAAHPVPDEAGFAATEKALALVHGLTAQDAVLFLLSGGGSALLEKPLIPGAELQDITSQLLASGADIVEMNTIRKRLSGVKGGRFALACAPAQVYSIVLSDILGDPLDMIASGPACPDSSTCAEAKAIAARYGLKLSPGGCGASGAGNTQSAGQCDHQNHRQRAGTVRRCGGCLPQSGLHPRAADRPLNCEAREAGRFLGSIAQSTPGRGKSWPF